MQTDLQEMRRQKSSECKRFIKSSPRGLKNVRTLQSVSFNNAHGIAQICYIFGTAKSDRLFLLALIFPQGTFGNVIGKSDNEFVGYISIKDTKSNLWEIAIELLQKYCHKGYGSRAVALFLPSISKVTN